MYAYCLNDPVNFSDPTGTIRRQLNPLNYLNSFSVLPEDSVLRPQKDDYSLPEENGTYGNRKGNVYIASESNYIKTINHSKSNDVVVVDYRKNSDPNIKIISSFKINRKSEQKEIIQIILDFNSENPVDPAWNRTMDSMVVEWDCHNLPYSLHYKRERTADVDFNNADKGKDL